MFYSPICVKNVCAPDSCLHYMAAAQQYAVQPYSISPTCGVQGHQQPGCQLHLRTEEK
uniref:Uncharacterized protein n=1 Tax=Brassica oleracea TaxID=3712 RepID=A0A3P6CM81_BRAOL|nr:unnamed protein product [Brassica oleracea]